MLSWCTSGSAVPRTNRVRISRGRTHDTSARVQPTVVGAGLVALDVVFNVSTGESPRYFADGNVLTIPSFLGGRAGFRE